VHCADNMRNPAKCASLLPSADSTIQIPEESPAPSRSLPAAQGKAAAILQKPTREDLLLASPRAGHVQRDRKE